MNDSRNPRGNTEFSAGWQVRTTMPGDWEVESRYEAFLTQYLPEDSITPVFHMFIDLLLWFQISLWILALRLCIVGE